jgi:hypothetical protein
MILCIISLPNNHLLHNTTHHNPTLHYITLHNTATLEVYMVAQWGFYGFVAATILSLVGTHVILYHHRRCIYHSEFVRNAIRMNMSEEQEQQKPSSTKQEQPIEEQSAPDGDDNVSENPHYANNNKKKTIHEDKCPEVTNTTAAAADDVADDNYDCCYNADAADEVDESKTMSLSERSVLWIVLLFGLAAYIVGCSLDSFQVSRQRGDVETLYEEFSILRVGAVYAERSRYNTPGDKWTQALWFLLTFIIPIVSSLLWGLLLLLIPSDLSSIRATRATTNDQHDEQSKMSLLEKVFIAAEIAFAWSCGEVAVLSTLFAVLQIPEFGDGIIDSGCSACYVIDSELLPYGLLPLVFGAFANVAVGLWMYRRVHAALYEVSSPLQ